MPTGSQRLAGRILGVLVVLFLVADGATGLFAPQTLAGKMAETGFPAAMIAPLSVVILACALVYAVPRTAVLGAILVTAFAGGAIATHFRLGQMAAPEQIVCALLAVASWGALWLRDGRVRALLPLA